MDDETAAYAELYCLSNFSFRRGASHPGELMTRAAELGYTALAVTDECSVAGVVRAHMAARETGLALIVGSEFVLEDGTTLVVLAPDRRAYGQLCALISLARSLAPKGAYRLGRAELAGALPDCLAILWVTPALTEETAAWFAGCFPGRGWLGVGALRDGSDAERLRVSARLSAATGVPRLACGGVLMHRRGRRALQDTLTAIRLGRPLAELGTALAGNGERHLRSRGELARLFPRPLLEEGVRVAARCRFSLTELRYEYPDELTGEYATPGERLRALVEAGLADHWKDGVPGEVRRQVEHELSVIAGMGYEPYFLTVHDVVEFARRRGILCQGRGSAANSVVCYCLGITAVNPTRQQLLFERFISPERGEPPDIDVDFEHERREEVIQYIYRRYGRERAALAATVITYRPRSALRDVGRALGLGQDQLERLAGAMQWWDGGTIGDERVREAGLDPESPVVHRLIVLARELLGFPRHLSQHVGGFVISRGPLAELVPTENAAMAGRSVIQWDKDDLEALGLLKVDCLSLGMLTAIRRCFELVARHHGRSLGLGDIPEGDPAVYDMIGRADTVGVFQVESRAQMAMLPRMRPQTFYDLVVEISIVRPGPIQGDMVHPYLRRREGLEPVDYPSEAVREVLERTYGVPIFQEQVMQLAVVAAGFTPGEADGLRRSMAAWRRKGGLGPFRERLVEGMRERGYDVDFAERVFQQILGFGEYGFPESHAASFALLVYVSAWLKHHYPAAFTAALLNSQPMGFYGPAQLVRDAREHGVGVRPVDVAVSEAACTLEPSPDDGPALRLGLSLVRGLSAGGIERLLTARRGCAFDDVTDLARRASLERRDLKALAAAGALAGLAGHRRRARWAVLGVEPELPVLRGTAIEEPAPALAPPGEGETLVADYASTGVSLGRHPLALLRPHLARRRFRTAAALREVGHGRLVRGAGLVITRQRPGSAGGVTFLTLEDETGVVNVVVWQATAERFRRAVVGGRLLGVIGTWERRGEVMHLVAGRIEDHSRLLGRLVTRSRDFA
ncbi:error-prone DNA polymerase [Arhodomonas aquaeolei]|uniref:error-prone DNA polymerase n=1 Tax=Arhodomonas aquaeolei TaxID=2369 RepID=UPI002169C198|nr:error-prone DNA polymerase [Arhodomonas aquaeolei]MCS4504650.1 error-prone DNA polymerase [Arhodomonas aquaeolei]